MHLRYVILIFLLNIWNIKGLKFVDKATKVGSIQKLNTGIK